MLVFLAVFLSGCMGPMHTYRYKMSQIVDYETGIDKTPLLPYAEKQQLIWSKVKEIFPEHYSEADRLLRHSLSLDAKVQSRTITESDIQEYLSEVRVFWGMVEAVAQYEEREYRTSWQRAAPIFQEASRNLQQQQRQYDDLNRSIREDRPINCTSQYRPWGNGMIDTTCY